MAVLIISLCFIYVYIQFKCSNNKTEYMNRFSYTYFNSQQYKKLKIGKYFRPFS